MVKASTLDIIVTQKGELYKVTGKDAPALRMKLLAVPVEVRDIEVSDFKDGGFTFRKIIPSYLIQPTG